MLYPFISMHMYSLWGNKISPVGIQAIEEYLRYWIHIQWTEWVTFPYTAYISYKLSINSAAKKPYVV